MISSCSDPVIKKNIHVHCVEVLHVAHTCVRSLDLKVALNKLCNVLENIDGKAQ